MRNASPELSRIHTVNRFRNRYFYVTASVLLVLIVVLMRVDRPVKQEKRIAERIASGKSVPTHYYVEPWLWKGLIVNIGLAGLLVAMTPFATRKLSGGYERQIEGRRPYAKWEWMALGCVMLVAAVQNAPRLSHSLWGDEEYTGRRLIADEVERDADGRLVIEKQSWLTTFWSFRKPTNHIGYTVAARAVHDAFFNPGMGPTDPWFSETLTRLPVYIAGLLSIPALLWACFVWGFRNGSVFLAFAYVLHPWFVRFGVDARGYGFVLLLTPLLIALLGRALQTGRWRWWLALGFVQFYLFWTYFGAVYFLVTFHLAALIMIATARDRTQADRWVVATRWFVANMMSVMLIVALEAPCLPQLFEFLAQKPLPGEIDRAWFLDAAAYVISGVPWYPWDAANPLCTAWTHHETWSLVFPIAAVIVAVAFIVGAASGTLTLWRHPQKRWLLIIIFGAPLLMIVHQWHSHIRPYHWYLIPYFPGVCLLLAAATSRLLFCLVDEKAAARQSWRVWTALGLIACFQGLTSKERRLLTTHPIEPCRESAALTRTITNPRHPDYDKDVITVAFAFTSEAYDPGQIKIENGRELRALMARADKEGKRLFVNFGHKPWAVMYFADIVAIVDDPALFEHTATLPGLFLASTRHVYRYKGQAPAN